MLEKIKDIQKALEAQAFLSALALALTLPDICGKVAYPEIKKIGERYAKWFDEYIMKKRIPPVRKSEDTFGGEKYYKLRCAFLHEGSTQGIPGVSKFELCIANPETPGEYGVSVINRTLFTNDTSSFSVKLDINMLCTDICIAAEDFYNSYEDKAAFNDQNITIVKYLF